MIEAFENFEHCCRNFDPDFVVPEEHIAEMTDALARAPAKNNIIYYDAFFITDKNLMRNLFEVSWTPDGNRRNSQLLANLLVMFIPSLREEVKTYAHDVEHAFADNSQLMMGIAAATLGLKANMMGYRTGFCGCLSFQDTVKTLREMTGKQLSSYGRGVALGIGKPLANRPHNYDPHYRRLVGRNPKAKPTDFITRIP